MTEALEEVTAAENAKAGNPRIRGFGSANPFPCFTQEETFRMLGYSSQRILKMFLSSGIEFRRFYLDPENFNRFETPDELNQRYLQGAMHTGRTWDSARTSSELPCSGWAARARFQPSSVPATSPALIPDGWL